MSSNTYYGLHIVYTGQNGRFICTRDGHGGLPQTEELNSKLLQLLQPPKSAVVKLLRSPYVDFLVIRLRSEAARNVFY